MAAAARPLHHIGYWVEDLEQAAWDLHATLGIGPFALAPHITFTEFVLAGRDPQEPVVFDHSAAFAAWGPTVIEIGQVHDIDPDLADAYGADIGTISHVSWTAPSLADELERLGEFGCEPINTAKTGPVSVLWVTGGVLFGHPIEVHQESPFILGMHDRLAVAAATWGGEEIFIPMG